MKLSNDAGRDGGGYGAEETKKFRSMLSDVCVSGVTLVKRRASLTAADAHLTLCAGKKTKTKILLEVI